MGISQGGLEGLATETRTHDLGGFAEKRIITLGGRQKKGGVLQERTACSPVPTPSGQIVSGGGSQG